MKSAWNAMYNWVLSCSVFCVKVLLNVWDKEYLIGNNIIIKAGHCSGVLKKWQELSPLWLTHTRKSTDILYITQNLSERKKFECQHFITANTPCPITGSKQERYCCCCWRRVMMAVLLTPSYMLQDDLKYFNEKFTVTFHHDETAFRSCSCDGMKRLCVVRKQRKNTDAWSVRSRKVKRDFIQQVQC
jgi:hypothetical protein